MPETVIITKQVSIETIESLELDSVKANLTAASINKFVIDSHRHAQVILWAGYYTADELEMVARDLRRLESLELEGKLNAAQK